MCWVALPEDIGGKRKSEKKKALSQGKGVTGGFVGDSTGTGKV